MNNTPEQLHEYKVNLTNTENIEQVVSVFAFTDDEAKSKAFSEHPELNKQTAEIITKWKV